MRRAKKASEKRAGARFVPAAAALVMLVGSVPSAARAQAKGQRTFQTAAAAAAALETAAKNNDMNGVHEILGPDGVKVCSSGDAVEDAANRATFVTNYEVMHRLVIEPDGTTTLYIGAKNWPWPIPLESKNGVWFFDTKAGEREILFRRIGRNELSTIRVLGQLVAAQKEYFSQQNAYAAQIFSDEGQHNGLYWKAAASEPQSPIGPLVAEAVAEGYDKGKNGPPTPYRGYLYHVLTSQGAGAPGGAKSYFVDGKMTIGFAFVAYPADYRSSGVMTFIVGPDGVIYQKDLGNKTEQIGKALKEYNPDSTWQRADQEETETASQP